MVTVSRTRNAFAALAVILIGACSHLQETANAAPQSDETVSRTVGAVNDAPAGPVRNEIAQAGEEIVTMRYWKIRKGTFPEFLKASQTGVWPYFEKIGSRVVGMWKVLPAPGEDEAPPDYDEVYLTTRYASVDHWAATRRAAELGGDGPDYKALQEALAVRRDLTIETHVIFLQGATGPMGPYYLPGTGERFQATE